MELLEGTLDVVARAQAGDDLALMKLMKIIDTHHKHRYINRYYGMNSAVNNDEIDSEFMLGVWLALSKAKLDVGNPINFICWSGQKKVQSLMKQNIRRETRFQCLECGATGTMGYKYKRSVCSECESPDIETWMIQATSTVVTADGSFDIFTLTAGVTAETAWQLAVYGIQLEEIRDRLSGRALELFDITVIEGINSGSSKNYLREIAYRWGTSQMRVVHAMRIVRRTVEAYLAEAEGC